MGMHKIINNEIDEIQKLFKNRVKLVDDNLEIVKLEDLSEVLQSLLSQVLFGNTESNTDHLSKKEVMRIFEHMLETLKNSHKVIMNADCSLDERVIALDGWMLIADEYNKLVSNYEEK